MSNINDLQEQFENLIKQGQELIEKMKKEQVAQEGKKGRKPKLIENGTKFGRLTVIGLDHINEYVDSKGQKRRIQFYLCECDCGNKTVVCRNSLKCANTKSCGCYNIECLVKRHKKHNMAGTKIYKVWTGMKKRCYNKNERLKNRSYLHELLYKLVGVAYKKELRLIIENPATLPHYLISIQNFPKPTIIDKNRMLRGDYFKKPTAYWFFNCEPTQGFTIQNDKKQKIISKCKQGVKAGVCSEERSMISPDYARNFICDFIIGKKQDIGQLQLF